MKGLLMYEMVVDKLDDCMLCYDMLYLTMLCYSMLCFTVLCFTVL